MRKYTLVATLAAEMGLVGSQGLIRPVMARESWLSLAHDPGYVDAVLHGKLTTDQQRRIGFEWTPAVADRARASASGTLLAARLALEHGAAVNAAGGSHHASHEGGAGFCVFNDVAIAARVLLHEGTVRQVLVIDCDVHQGDGTARIFADESAVFTFSIHCEDNWPRDKPPSDLDVGLNRGTQDLEYNEILQHSLDRVFSRVSPEIVFYNGGVDPHIDDRLGLLELTDAGLAARDAMVAEACASRHVPVVGVLGGGYGDDAEQVARRHLLMFRALSEIAG